MSWLKTINMASLVIIVGATSTIGWVTVDGTDPPIISLAGGGLVALKGTLGRPG